MMALQRILPVIVGLAVLAAWEIAVWATGAPRWLIPPPSAIAVALVTDWPVLLPSLWTTLSITLSAFALAVIGGTALAVLFTQSRWLEAALFPYAVVLQVTPLVAIAPLVVIWVGLDNANRAVLVLALIAAFFPIPSNMMIGLRSADLNLRDLMKLYGASRMQILWRLALPSALPYLTAGMKTAAGLALLGTVVAEFVAGSGTATGLAWRIVEAGNRLQGLRMFASLVLLSGLGIALWLVLNALERRLLGRWHESTAR